MTDRNVRILVASVALVQVVTALLFAAGVPAVVALWPLEGWTDLSFVLVASILIAAAASTGWCLLSGSDRALAGIGLDVVAIFVPLATVGVVRAADGSGSSVLLVVAA